MEIDQLRTLLSVLEHGSFSRAGEALGVGQSTVSFHIKALEAAVGATLVVRRGGPVRPTESGIRLRGYANKIVSLADAAIAGVASTEAGESGRLAIAASTIPAEYLLPPVLAEFSRDRPGVAISVEVSDSKRAIAALIAEELDLALVGSRIRHKRIVYAPFADDAIVLIAPGKSPHARASHKLAPEDLEGEAIILREEGSGTRDALGPLLARLSAHGGTRAPVSIGSTEAVKRCVIEGMGLAFLSRRAVADDLASGRLSIVPLAGTPVKRRFFTARMKTGNLGTAGRTLLKMLQAYYR